MAEKSISSKIKNFFDKKKSEAKFKMAGPGYKLTDSSSGGGGSSSSRKNDGKFKKVERGEQSEAEKAAAAAALARFGGGPSSSNSREVHFNTSYASIQAQAKKELEKERQLELAKKNLASGSPKVERKEPIVKELDAAPVLAVNGVYFKCPMIGDEVLTKEEWNVKIREFLYANLSEEEKGLTASLMIKTLNKQKEKVDQCIETLIKYLNNIIQNPDEEKYRKIRMSNRIFEEKVRNIEGASQFLEACGFNEMEIDGEKYLMYSSKPKDPEAMDVEVLIDALMSCEPIKLEVDRNIRVFNATSSASLQNKIELPLDFYHRSPEEIKNEQKQRSEQIELEMTLRTKAMRERDAALGKEIRNYKFCIVRIKFPDGYIIQGTFSVYEKYSHVLIFVRENIHQHIETFSLSISSHKFTSEDESLSLLELKLVPAVLLNFNCDSMPLQKSVEDINIGDSYYLKPEVAILLQD